MILLGLGGCARYSTPAESVRRAPPEPIAVAPPKLYAGTESSSSLDQICKVDPAACPKLDLSKESARDIKEQVYAVQQVSEAPGPSLGLIAAPAPSPPPPSPPQPIQVGKGAASRAEMIDVEARMELEVESIASALVRIRDLVAKAGGQLVNEVVENKPGSAGAALSVRVPTPAVAIVLAELERTGKLLSRKVESRDVGREYHDAQIQASNLAATLKRYEELLEKAKDTKEVLAIEEELSRVRSEMDRVQGDLRYLADRASRATVYVVLTSLRPDAEVVEPHAKVHLGLRGTLPFDFSDAHGARGFAGGGLSLMFSRSFSVDADWATRLRDGDGVQFFLVTAGGDLYSDRLGGGRRSTFNPYVGLRAGYASLLADGAFAIGGTLGLELWKNNALSVALEARVYGLIGLDDGSHALLEPGATVHLAY